jgi:glycosyltransferase involved in cell wall biosynthesis
MESSVQLGIVTTHPIQYQIPLFRALEERSEVSPTVFFERLPDPEQQGEGFDVSFEWDLPLLDGYSWQVLQGDGQNREKGPSTFQGFRDAFQKIDVMLIHGWQSAFMHRAWWQGVWKDIPLLVRGESNNMRSRPWYIHGLHRMYLRAFDRYLHIGKSNKEFYRSAGVATSALYPAPYCVENSRFVEDWETRREVRPKLRADLGVDDSATCFLFCGKFIEKKRPADVVSAFTRAWKESDLSMHLLMVGDGELRPQTEELTPPSAPITFTGFLNQTEIGDAYAAGDVMVLPSNYGETWGLVVNEGMIFEMPAIVSDRVGCGPDLIKEGKTGYTFPFGDVDALASTIKKMARSPDHTREMGAKARELILSEYTIEKAADAIVDATLDAYRAVR